MLFASLVVVVAAAAAAAVVVVVVVVDHLHACNYIHVVMSA